jgi:4-amino-4-deoxy-L-arabinose transferase-like glycosyltransferase
VKAPSSIAQGWPGRDGHWPWLLVGGLLLWHLLIGLLVPVTRDEAYYLNWAWALNWGYFDHPPAVALLGVGSLLAPGSALAGRLGAVLAGALTLWVLWQLYRRAGLRPGHGLLLALILAAGTFPGLAAGVILTPDTPLALCWALALHESLAALDGDRRRWLGAGAASGLGLLGKYTMVVIGPVFLWAILLVDRRALATPWPYLGGLLALLLFLPNLLWNANNDWVTLRFQFGHGFAADTGELVLAAERLLPAAVGVPGSPGPEPVVGIGDRLAGLGGFIGSELLFWGLLVLPMAAGLLVAGGPRRMIRDLRATLTPPARALFTAGALFPLVLFGAVALVSDVEANWAAMYLTAAAPIAAAALRPLGRWVLAAAATNLLLVTLYAFHAATDLLPLPPSQERILRDTHGFDALAVYLEGLSAPVVADRYPFAAMINFYQPRLAVVQWPGITRPSEYLRGRIVTLPRLADLQRTGFWLLARKFQPPSIPGFESDATRSLYDCRGQTLRVLDGARDYYRGAHCREPLHVWRLYHYRSHGDARGLDQEP